MSRDEILRSLRDERDRIDRAIAELDGKPSKTSPKSSRVPMAEKITDARALFDQHPKKAFRASEIQQAVRGCTTANVYHLLNELKRTKVIRKVGDGTYVKAV